MPHIKLLACTQLFSMHLALDKAKFFGKCFDNILRLTYLLHLESRVSRDMWIFVLLLVCGVFLS